MASANRGYQWPKRRAPWSSSRTYWVDERSSGASSVAAIRSPPRAASDSPTPSVPSGSITVGSGAGSLICATAGTSPSTSITSMTADGGSSIGGFRQVPSWSSVSTAWPAQSRTSRCRCGWVEQPALPAIASGVPGAIGWPGRTRAEPRRMCP
jgi:hypothetical protein